MPVTIGGKAESGFDDPLGLLADCHRRIERFLGTLRAVASQAAGRRLTSEEQAAVSNALRYFREAAPRHIQDEEESLFPRMRLSTAASAAEGLAALEGLEADHAVADARHAAIAELFGHWITDGLPAPGETASLTEHLRALTALYAAHIEVEETRVFPAAGRLLDHAAREAMGREMAARRGIAPKGP